MRPTIKILSLVATVQVASACGGAARTHVREPIATRTVVGATVTPADVPSEIGLVETPILVIGTPLLQANGRPAPGNVQSKRDEDMD